MAHHDLLLHLVREIRHSAANRLHRKTLRVDRTTGTAIAELAFRLAHGVAGLAELLARTGLLPKTALLQFLQQLVELIPQRLLLFAQAAHAILVALLALF